MEWERDSRVAVNENPLPPVTKYLPPCVWLQYLVMDYYCEEDLLTSLLPPVT